MSLIKNSFMSDPQVEKWISRLELDEKTKEYLKIISQDGKKEFENKFKALEEKEILIRNKLFLSFLKGQKRLVLKTKQYLSEGLKSDSLLGLREATLSEVSVLSTPIISRSRGRFSLNSSLNSNPHCLASSSPFDLAMPSIDLDRVGWTLDDIRKLVVNQRREMTNTHLALTEKNKKTRQVLEGLFKYENDPIMNILMSRTYLTAIVDFLTAIQPPSLNERVLKNTNTLIKSDENSVNLSFENIPNQLPQLSIEISKIAERGKKAVVSLQKVQKELATSTPFNEVRSGLGGRYEVLEVNSKISKTKKSKSSNSNIISISLPEKREPIFKEIKCDPEKEKNFFLVPFEIEDYRSEFKNILEDCKSCL